MAEIPIKMRIRHFAHYLQMNDQDFQNEAHLGDGFMNRNSEPSSPLVAKILQRYPALSPDWLILGVGPMLRPMTSEYATVPGDSSSGNDTTTDDDFADIDDPDIQAALNPFAGVAEPTQPYRRGTSKETITIPLIVWEQLRKQLENKDAQIATLLTAIQH